MVPHIEGQHYLKSYGSSLYSLVHTHYRYTSSYIHIYAARLRTCSGPVRGTTATTQTHGALAPCVRGPMLSFPTLPRPSLHLLTHVSLAEFPHALRGCYTRLQLYSILAQPSLEGCLIRVFCGLKLANLQPPSRASPHYLSPR